jgi:hypothetical protein
LSNENRPVDSVVARQVVSGAECSSRFLWEMLVVSGRKKGT